MKTLRKVLTVVLIAGMGLFISGCYGSFALTKKVHQFNGTVGNKYVNEAVFLALNIIPVYGTCAAIDVLFLNTIEFWTGSNPFALKTGVNKINHNGQELTVIIDNTNARILDNTENTLAILTFNEKNSTWSYVINGGEAKLLKVQNAHLVVYAPSGKALNIAKSKLNAGLTAMK